MTIIEASFERPNYPSYEGVAQLDPLNLDDFLAKLPSLNYSGHREAMVEALRDAVSLSSLADLDRPSAIAALRDLDFIASSILKNGLNPIDTIPGLEQEMIRLGNAGNTVPRGTVYTYAAANPRGDRQRSFTGSPQEDLFIEAVRSSIYGMDEALERVGGLPSLMRRI